MLNLYLTSKAVFSLTLILFGIDSFTSIRQDVNSILDRRCVLLMSAILCIALSAIHAHSPCQASVNTLSPISKSDTCLRNQIGSYYRCFSPCWTTLGPRQNRYLLRVWHFRWRTLWMMKLIDKSPVWRPKHDWWSDQTSIQSWVITLLTSICQIRRLSGVRIKDIGNFRCNSMMRRKATGCITLTHQCHITLVLVSPWNF